MRFLGLRAEVEASGGGGCRGAGEGVVIEDGRRDEIDIEGVRIVMRLRGREDLVIEAATVDDGGGVEEEEGDSEGAMLV
jgi:hypothetical protein